MVQVGKIDPVIGNVTGYVTGYVFGKRSGRVDSLFR